MEYKNRINALRKKIDDHNYHYYVLDDPRHKDLHKKFGFDFALTGCLRGRCKKVFFTLVPLHLRPLSTSENHIVIILRMGTLGRFPYKNLCVFYVEGPRLN